MHTINLNDDLYKIFINVYVIIAQVKMIIINIYFKYMN